LQAVTSLDIYRISIGLHPVRDTGSNTPLSISKQELGVQKQKI